MRLKSKKTIIVADKLQDMGGGEIVLAQICEALKPEYIVTTTVNKKHDWGKLLGNIRIITPFWGKFVKNRFVWFLFYPVICFLMSRIRVSSDEAILIYSSTASKYIKAFSKKKIVLYSNYPARGIFFPREFFKSIFILTLIRPFVAIFKVFEMKCIKRYENIYVISKACQAAYKKVMSINSIVVNCPTDNNFYDYYDRSKHIQYSERLSLNAMPTFILVSRLVDWKNIDYVLECFENQTKFKLKIVGGGPLLDYYRMKYHKNCKFLGYLSVDDKIRAMETSCGLIFPSVQEWSVASIEANSLGLPVLGVRCAGTDETQIIFSKSDVPATCFVFEMPNSESLANAMELFISINWDSSFIHEHSKKFSPAVFRKKIKAIIND